jgi:hypothetical protein
VGVAVQTYDSRNRDLRVGQFMELHDPSIIERQIAFVRKMVEEVNDFDNIYFEINNETSARANSRETAARQDAWHLALSKAIRETEQKLPKKHLIAINAHQRLATSDFRELRYTETGDAPYFGNALVDIIISQKTAGPGISVLEPLERDSGISWRSWRLVFTWTKRWCSMRTTRG